MKTNNTGVNAMDNSNQNTENNTNNNENDRSSNDNHDNANNENVNNSNCNNKENCIDTAMDTANMIDQSFDQKQYFMDNDTYDIMLKMELSKRIKKFYTMAYHDQ